MSTWAIIPAKDPQTAKRRLAPVLSPFRRWSLSMYMLEHALQVVSAAGCVDRYVVISSAAQPLALARVYGAVTVHELVPQQDATVQAHAEGNTPEPQQIEFALNSALKQAAEVAIRGGATALLVMPSDLLLLTAEEIDSLIADLPPERGIVLAPDRHRTGTNALLMRPPAAIPFAFGPHSFDEHRRLAEVLGVQLAIHDRPAFALDLDTPADLDLVSTLQPETAIAPWYSVRAVHWREDKTEEADELQLVRTTQVVRSPWQG